jgi:transcriptional regulator GlxA family with amidase domain
MIRHASIVFALLAFAVEAAGAGPPASAPRRNVAVFVHAGVELLDCAGPGEVFAAAGRGKFRVYTVAATKDPIVSQGFLRVTPEFSIDDCPPPDVLVIPGGATNVPLGNDRVVEWIKKSSAKAEITLSVCTGAFLLAKAGLLEGGEATTHWGSIDRLRKAAPTVKVVTGVRFVDRGKVVTAAGVSAGIDASLHVVQKLLGAEAAKQTARYMEYDWKPGPPDAK